MNNLNEVLKPAEKWDRIHQYRNLHLTVPGTKKLTHKEIADLVGCSESLVRKHLNGKRPPDFAESKGGRYRTLSPQDEAAILRVACFYYMAGEDVDNKTVRKIIDDYFKDMKPEQEFIPASNCIAKKLMSTNEWQQRKKNYLTSKRFGSYNRKYLDSYSKIVRAALLRAKVAKISNGQFVITHPHLILNIDETSATQGFQKRKKSKKTWVPKGMNPIGCDDTVDQKLQNITAVCTISMDGEFYKPYKLLKNIDIFSIKISKSKINFFDNFPKIIYFLKIKKKNF